jgi:hypothetical protein
LFLRTKTRGDASVLGASILTLAVDRHGGGDDQSFRPPWECDEALEKARRRERVHADVPLDLVHRLADADRRRQVDHGVDALQRSVSHHGISHVAVDERHAVGQHGVVAEVYLRLGLSTTTTSSPRSTRCATGSSRRTRRLSQGSACSAADSLPRRRAARRTRRKASFASGAG